MNTEESLDFIVTPAGQPLRGSIRVPGDKSISHRAIMLGAIATGVTEINGFLDSEDTRATVRAFRDMGVSIEQDGSMVRIHGAGKHGLEAPVTTLDFGNSGTAARLMCGLLAAQSFDSTVTGDVSLRQRPMRRITDPLHLMRADISTTPAGNLPVAIRGGRSLQGIPYTLPVASAQIKSALLLAGLYAAGDTVVREPSPCRDHTERMFQTFACPVSRKGLSVTVAAAEPQAAPIAVPGDVSSAAFFIVAASIVPGSDIEILDVGLNPTRHAVIGLLQAMGADITVRITDTAAAEPAGNLRVRYSKLRGIDVPAATVAVAIDEFPVLLVAAAVAEGVTTLRNAAELRLKESDRINAMTQGLTRLGIATEEFADGIAVTGGGFKGGTVNSFTDHRIAMAFTVAGLAASAAVTVEDCANVATSFPGFLNCARELGANISTRSA